MAGYIRQSATDIVPTAVVRSAPVNAEFNSLRDAFSSEIGHKHDGSSSEGVYVPLIADTEANNKVVVNSINNSIDIYNEVSAVPALQVSIKDGVVVPAFNNDIDLGTSTVQFKNLYLDGTAKVDTLTVDENATIAGTLGVTGLSTLASADINSGTIDGTVIGATSAQAVTGTNITATAGFVGQLTGNVTGNLTGNSAGTHTGPVIGSVTGDVTSAGTSSFANVTISGSLDMNAGTSATVTGLSAPVNSTDAATKVYVDTSIANLIDASPGTLDTLNELAAALGDDPNFAGTVTTSIATKLPLAGGTMSGAIAMGTNKVTGVGNPTAAQDAATKSYVDTQDTLKLSLTGGTMTGSIAMGANKITSTATPTVADDLTRKGYIDTLFGSTVSAATSAAAAVVSETNAAGSASAAATSATIASDSAAAAAASFDSFDDRYLGAKSVEPAVDNDGNPLITGALYFDSTANLMRVYDGNSFLNALTSVNGTSERVVYTASSGQTTFNVVYDIGYVDVYLNGIKLLLGTDFTATSGTNIVLTTGAIANDTVDIVSYGAFSLADHYTKTQSDARYALADDALALAIALG